MCRKPPDIKRHKEILCEARLNLYESWVPRGHARKSALILAAALKNGGCDEAEALEVVSYWRWNMMLNSLKRRLKRSFRLFLRRLRPMIWVANVWVRHCPHEQDKWECRDCQLSQLVC